MSGALTFSAGIGDDGGLAVTANNVTKTSSGFAASGTVTSTQLPNANPVGGSSPYTYVWARISGSTAPAVSSATARNPSWSGTVTDGVVEAAVWRVTVTDALSATAEVDITVTLIWGNLS